MRYTVRHQVIWAFLAIIFGASFFFALTSVGKLTLSFVAPEGEDSLQRVGLTEASVSPEDTSEIRLGQVSAHADIPREGKAVHANLESMVLSLYEDGKVVATSSILSKGRPGTPWETPAGAYEVRFKTPNHFSSIGNVWMPYSMQFFGNYFVHGWPHYPDGTPVSEGYSGGCIRLSTEDAKKVFDFVDVHTPLVVENPDKVISENDLNFFYSLKDPKERVTDINAASYLIADLDTGDIILKKGEREVRQIASLTKLMTALVSLDVINQYQIAYVSDTAVETYGDAGQLEAGDSYEVGTLIYPLLLESSNDAAEVLAEHHGRSFFVDQMNARAAAIGMQNTSFSDPSGLSDFNVGNAEDLMMLTRYVYKNKHYILDITQEVQHAEEGATWYNNSKFIYDERYLGGKNGYTDKASRTQVALFSLPLAEFGSRNIAIVVLGSDDAVKDVYKLVKYLEDNVYFGDGTLAEEHLAERAF